MTRTPSWCNWHFVELRTYTQHNPSLSYEFEGSNTVFPNLEDALHWEASDLKSEGEAYRKYLKKQFKINYYHIIISCFIFKVGINFYFKNKAKKNIYKFIYIYVYGIRYAPCARCAYTAQGPRFVTDNICRTTRAKNEPDVWKMAWKGWTVPMTSDKFSQRENIKSLFNSRKNGWG